MNADVSVERFLEQWYNGQDYVEAHTSGSTGKPKIIRLSKSDMITSAMATCERFSIASESTLVMPLSADYIAGKMMIVRALVSGAKLWIEEPSNSPLKKDYDEIALLPVVPSQVLHLISEQKLGCVKNLIIGGGVLSQKIEQQLIDAGANAFATYGMTETCSHVALRKIGTKYYEAMPGIEFATDERDCLKIIAPKYTFKQIVTNDVVKLINSKMFSWIGRWDNVINTGGIKFFPEEIESKINDLIKSPFYIAGVPDDKWGESIVLYIETENRDFTALREDITNRLGHKYFVPKMIIAVKEFERTKSGKIKRKIIE